MPNGYLERDIEETPAYLDEVMGMIEPTAEDLNASGAPLPPPQMRQGFRERGFGVLEKFNPETGQRETFTAVNPPGTRLPQFPIPRPQRDPMEEMRKTINAIQFQKANDAYKAALSFQAARAYRQDLDAGKSQGEALARWGHLLPGGLAGAAAMTRVTQPVINPTVTNIGGVNVLRYGQMGAQARAIPQSALPQPAFTPTVRTVEGERVIQLGRNRWQYLGKEFATKDLPAGIRASIYRQQISEADKELADLPTEAPSRSKIEQRKQAAIEARDAMLSPAKPGSKTNEITRLTKDGRKAIFNADTKAFIRYAD